jgi:hypothetical protein
VIRRPSRLCGLCFFNTLGFWRSCVHQLELLPAHRLGVACEYQNGEVIQVPNGGGHHDRAALIVRSPFVGLISERKPVSSAKCEKNRC